MIIGIPLILFFVIFISLIANETASANPQVIATSMFSLPFKKGINYHITSGYGYRIDPLNRGTLFHDGIDMSAPAGTNVLASNNGKVAETGFQVGGLGNYVCIEHLIENETYFSCYGHMLDNSIVVHKNQNVQTGNKIGKVGSTGASTGNHLHFMLLSPVLIFNKKYTVDPTYFSEWLK